MKETMSFINIPCRGGLQVGCIVNNYCEKKIIISLTAALNKLISKLDRRRLSTEKKKGTFSAKKRVASIQSTLSPPRNAPKWTLTSEYISSPQPSGSSGMSSSTAGSTSRESVDTPEPPETSTPNITGGGGRRSLLDTFLNISEAEHSNNSFSCTDSDI